MDVAADGGLRRRDVGVMDDRAGLIAYANREFERCCGSGASPVRRPLGEAWPAMDRVAAHASYLHGRASGAPVRFKYVCRAGTRYEISARPVDDALSSLAFRRLNDLPPSPRPAPASPVDPHARPRRRTCASCRRLAGPTPQRTAS